MDQTHDGLLPGPWLRLVLTIKFAGQHEAIVKSSQTKPDLPGSWDNKTPTLWSLHRCR